MGYNTTVFILNDQLSSLERDPERFVSDIIYGLNDGNDHALGQTTVMESQHADVPRLYFTHQNSIVELSKYSRRTEALYKHSVYGKAMVDDAIRAARDALDALEKAAQGWSS